MRRPMLLAAIAATVLLIAPAAEARRAPAKLLSRDAVQVLQTGKLRFRVGSRVVTVPLSDANRRRMSSCATMFVTLRVAGRRVRLACRRGFLVRASKPPKPPKPPKGTVYEVGVGARSISPEPDGMWQGQKVFLGGYGFGGGSPLLGGPLGDRRPRRGAERRARSSWATGRTPWPWPTSRCRAGSPSAAATSTASSTSARTSPRRPAERCRPSA